MKKLLLLIAIVTGLSSCASHTQNQSSVPFVSDRLSADATDISRIDPLIALDMLHSEDLYAQSYFDKHESLTRRLLEDMEDDIPEVEEEAPSLLGSWEYFSRREPGDLLPVIWRRSPGNTSAAMLVLDPNQLREAPGGTLDKLRISPDGSRILFTMRSTSVASPALYCREMQSGAISGKLAENVSEMEWAGDSQSFLFTSLETQRPARLYRQSLNSDTAQLLLEDQDKARYLWLTRSKDAEYIFLEAASAIDNRVYWLKAADASGKPLLLAQPEHGVTLRTEHHDGRFYLLRKSAAMGTSLSRRKADCIADCTETLLATDDPSGSLEDLEVFYSFLVLYRQNSGRRSLEFYDHMGKRLGTVRPELPVYALDKALNPDYRSRRFRYHLSSYNLSPRIIEYSLDTQTELILPQAAPAANRANKYTTSRLNVTAADGTLIPVSMVWRKDKPNKPAPLLLSAYGAYGTVKEDDFTPELLPLLDRGFIYAVAHVRGGGENGPGWHASGRMLAKRNSFSDFADCARKLIADGLTTPAQLFAQGQSAGGLIMGVMANEQPGLFRGILMEAPFLDPLGSALDQTLPHSQREYAEWGDPADKKMYANLAGYSPLQNIQAQPYPAMLLVTSLKDELVSPLQALAWTRRARAASSSTSPVLLILDKAGSHSSRATRHDHLYFKALQHTFLLSLLAPL